MHTINSTTELAGNITICVVNKTIEDRTQHVVFVCLYIYEFGLSLWKIVRSSVNLLLPLFNIF